jgi:predicted hydrocarbon binding protein
VRTNLKSVVQWFFCREREKWLNVAKHGMLVAMEKCLKKAAGRPVAAKVMEGSEQITEKTDRKRSALWVKGAMERLDALVDEENRVKVMQDCGYNCAKINHKVIDRAVARRKRYASTEDFLAAEQQKPMKGTRLVCEGNVLYQYYTPQTFMRPVRCYCSLISGLPPEDTISLTYCNCSKGFVEKYWEAILQKPVKVDLVQSAISGAKECKFVIHL